MTMGLRILLACTCLIAVIGRAEPAPAQQKNTAVPRGQSNVLLDMPGLENGVEQFHYYGWNANFSVEVSLAYVVAGRANFPAAAAILQQLGKGFLWRASTLDEAWIRRTAFPLKDAPIRITRPGRVGSDGYLNTVLFSSGNVNCLGFDFRRYAKGLMDSQLGSGEAGHIGFYCGAPGEEVGEEAIPRIVAGVYVRAGGAIRRAYELDASPIPDRVRR